MCSEPVTFGGGIAIVYGVRLLFGSELAVKKPLCSQTRYQCGSTSRGS